LSVSGLEHPADLSNVAELRSRPLVAGARAIGVRIDRGSPLEWNQAFPRVATAAPELSSLRPAVPGDDYVAPALATMRL